MKIVYKKSILDRILEAILEAEREGKQIDYIEVTKDEEKVLRKKTNTPDMIDSLIVQKYPDLTPWGVMIKVEGTVWHVMIKVEGDDD